MSNLSNFDAETITYIIENKISPKVCEQILIKNKEKLNLNLGSSINQNKDMSNLNQNSS